MVYTIWGVFPCPRPTSPSSSRTAAARQSACPRSSVSREIASASAEWRRESFWSRSCPPPRAGLRTWIISPPSRFRPADAASRSHPNERSSSGLPAGYKRLHRRHQWGAGEGPCANAEGERRRRPRSGVVCSRVRTLVRRCEECEAGVQSQATGDFSGGADPGPSIRRRRRARRRISARRPRSRRQTYRGLRPPDGRAGAEASLDTRDRECVGVFTGERPPLAGLGQAVAAIYSPPAVAFLTNPNWLISTVPSGKRAVILSSPPMALTKSCSVLTYMSVRRSSFETAA